LVKTPGQREMVVPTSALAAAIAEEWDAQQAEIRRETMPLTRLAGAAIDRNATEREAIVRQVAHYAGTDLVSYRASHPPALAARRELSDRGWGRGCRADRAPRGTRRGHRRGGAVHDAAARMIG